MSQELCSKMIATRIEDLITGRQLSAVFQPIIDFDDGAILGYEGLIRGPAGMSLEMPFALFRRAETEGSTIRLERAAARTCLDAFAKLNCEGKLFLNFSAGAIHHLAEAQEDVSAMLRHSGVEPQRIGIELTDQNRNLDVASCLLVITSTRTARWQFGL